jgi:hypothetical protein
METADVRKRILEAMAGARRAAAERRARTDFAAVEYARFLEATAVPLCRQVVNVLRAEGHPFTLGTPAGSVRLSSDRVSDDFVELTLDTSGDRPVVMGRRRRRHGGRVVESERPVNEHGTIGDLTDAELLSFLARELEPFLER